MNTLCWKILSFAGPLLFGAAGAVAATFTVNSTADLPDADQGDGIAAACSGECTLRAAIMQANYTGGTNTIIVPPGVYVLTRPGEDDNAVRGDLDISQSLLLQGAGPGLTIVDGNGAVTGDRVFQILSTATNVTLSGLTIRNGSRVANLFDAGGGLYWDGGYGCQLNLTNVIVENNRAYDSGGLYLNYAQEDTVILDHVVVRANTATAAAGGLGVNFGVDAGFHIVNSQVYSNSAYEGGGIYFQGPPASPGVLSILIETTGIYSNSATLSAGFENHSSDTNHPVTVLNSHLQGNTAVVYGGAIGNFGTMVIRASTLDANSAGLGGGAIYCEASRATLLSSTISGNNVTNGSGAGIFNGPAVPNIGSTLTVSNCTIAGNNATGGSGGGITNSSTSTVTAWNTILAGNTAQTPTSGPDFSGNLTSLGFNLIGNTNGMTVTGTTTGNRLNVNPLLGPLQDNGGPTFTRVLLPGSPAIDAGNSGSLTNDQRGFPRPYDTQLPNAAGGNGADIGAVEINPGTLLVLNNSDNGAGSLRQAISDNAALGGSNTIAFSNSVTGVITLTNGELAVATPLTILGPGANVLAVSANHNGRVFDVLGGPVTISGLTLRDGFIAGTAGASGQIGSDGRGGGIFNQDTLTLSNCIVRSNTVVGGLGGPATSGSAGSGGQGLGGGIYNAAGNLFLFQSTFDGNASTGGAGGSATTGNGGFAGNGLGGAICTISGTNILTGCTLMNGLAKGGQGGTGGSSSGIGGQGYGGGLYSESEVAFVNCTVNSNNATAGTGGGGPGTGIGGGIYNLSDMGLTNCTIANNIAGGSSVDSGGGIHNNGTLTVYCTTIVGNQADYGGGLEGFVTAGNTIVAGNSATVAGSDGSGTIISSDYNLIQNAAGLNFSGVTTHNIVGQNPLLGPLQNNGGPTFTMALLSNSPAIDQGNNFGSTTDQRGRPRPYDLPSMANAGGGDGSDIGAFEFLPTPILNIQSATNHNVVLIWAADAASFRLESAPNLPAANTWSNVTSPRITVGNQVYVTNSAVGASKFYRLSFP